MSTSASKPGYKTTEFWGTILFHLAKLSLYLLGTVEADCAVTASGIVQSFTRSLAEWPRGTTDVGGTGRTFAGDSRHREDHQQAHPHQKRT
jgi:hypothetical protein